jgi:hypothetical protein
MRKTLITLALFSVLAGPAAAYDCNIDLKNTGFRTAWDVAVVLEGQENVTGTYNGVFQSMCHDRTGTDTILHWENPKGAPFDDGIQPGEEIHVGWSVADGNSRPRDMYWTDEFGRRIPGSKIMTVTGYIGTGGIVFSNGTPDYVVIGPPKYTVRDRAWALADLVVANAELMGALTPLAADSVTLAPGAELFVPYPAGGVPVGATVVSVYETTSPGGAAQARVFVQDTAR